MVFANARHRHALAAGAFLATTTVIAGAVATAATPSLAGSAAATLLRPVTYRGYTFEVPRSWPVINLAADPATCVRFDQHALYLGRPGPSQSCPSGLVGATEAMLVEPATTAGSPAQARSTEDPVSHQIQVSAPRITVAASYNTDRAQILGILRSAGLPSPAIQNPAAMLREGPAATPSLSLSATNLTGYGFDACAAPAQNLMNAWIAHSSYQAIGIYIGGSDRSCPQPNLTAAWVSQQAAAGWHFIPLYVGPQVAYTGEVTAARPQAVAAAQDAVVQAQALGFGPGTLIYYDMEAYLPARTQAALKFFSAWTTELHSLGYKAAVYSSSDSGISDLASNYSNSAFTMPDVIYDAWWNDVADTNDPNVPDTDWANHARVHQYAGDVTETYGGYSLPVDQDYLDVQLGGGSGGGGGGGGGGSAPPTRQASQAVATVGKAVYAFYTGTDDGLWYTQYQPHSGWSAPARLASGVNGEPSAVATASGVTVFYWGTDGALHYLTSQNGTWSGVLSLSMGTLGSAPEAVSTNSGAINVFWRGRNGFQLWNANYTPGSGWLGPNRIGNALASEPSPAVSGAGTVSVFWKGRDGHLWYISRPPGQAWSAQATLQVGQLRKGPHATGQRGGQVGVFWGGSGRSIWRATYTGQDGWSLASLAGSGMSGAPAVIASSGSTENAFWKGRGAQLWQATSQGGASWDAAAPLALGRIGSEVFAAGQSDGVVDVFWRAPGTGSLWHSRYYPHGGTWTRPHDLGGNVG